MASPSWYSMISDQNGRPYYFHVEGGKAQRVAKHAYEQHHQRQSQDKTPKYWSVSTIGADGKNKSVFLTRSSTDDHVYEISPSSFHGALASDPAAMDRIAQVLQKHKALLRETEGPAADLPPQVTYNLNSANIGTAFALPSITADEIKTRAAFNIPTSLTRFNRPWQTTIAVPDVSRRSMVTLANAAKNRTMISLEEAQKTGKLDDKGQHNTFETEKTGFVLSFTKYKDSTYKAREKILTDTTTKKFFPDLQDHWHSEESSYWLYDMRNTQKFEIDSKDEEEKTKKIEEIQKLLQNAQFAQLYVHPSTGDKFTAKDFFIDAGGKIRFQSCINAALYTSTTAFDFAGSCDDDTIDSVQKTITGYKDVDTAKKANTDALGIFIATFTPPS